MNPLVKVVMIALQVVRTNVWEAAPPSPLRATNLMTPYLRMCYHVDIYSIYCRRSACERRRTGDVFAED